MAYISGLDRQQVVLFPEAIDDYIAADNPVRFLDEFVASLDLLEFGFQRSEPAATGRPGYDPADLLRLYLYGYLHRIRSSRRLEAEAERNLELIWLLRRLTPDFKTIADFRKDNLAALRAVCRRFTLLCKELALFGAELVAIDGSKFRAVNSTQRNYTPRRLASLQKRIDENIQRYLQSLDAIDREEAGTERPSAEALREKIATLQERQAKYARLQERLEGNPEGQISLTDPDSRRMQVKGGAVDVCYNVQIAVDRKHKLIVADDVTNEETDRDQLSPLAQQAKEAVGAETLEVVADAGYYHASQVKQCLEAQILPFVPRPRTSANQPKGLYTKDDFRYDAEQDVYLCPAGQTLTYRFQTVEKKRPLRYYSTSACSRCPLKSRCTENKRSRRITRTTDEHLVEAMEARLQARAELLKERRCLAEHPFGTMKRGMHAGFFLMKGLEKVRTEFSLLTFAYNLKRALAVLGTPALRAALR